MGEYEESMLNSIKLAEYMRNNIDSFLVMIFEAYMELIFLKRMSLFVDENERDRLFIFFVEANSESV